MRKVILGIKKKIASRYQRIKKLFRRKKSPADSATAKNSGAEKHKIGAKGSTAKEGKSSKARKSADRPKEKQSSGKARGSRRILEIISDYSSSSTSESENRRRVSFADTAVIQMYPVDHVGESKKDTLQSKLFKYMRSPPPSIFEEDMASSGHEEALITEENFSAETPLERKIIEKINEKSKNIKLLESLIDRIRSGESPSLGKHNSPCESRGERGRFLDIIDGYSDSSSCHSPAIASSASGRYRKCAASSTETCNEESERSIEESPILQPSKRYELSRAKNGKGDTPKPRPNRASSERTKDAGRQDTISSTISLALKKHLKGVRN